MKEKNIFMWVNKYSIILLIFSLIYEIDRIYITIKYIRDKIIFIELIFSNIVKKNFNHILPSNQIKNYKIYLNI